MADVQVVTRDSATGALTIGMSTPPTYVSGIDLLVQVVVIEMLSSPGRDVLNPENGGNLRSLIGTNVDYDDEAEIYAEIRLMISTVEKNIKLIQRTTSRPASEKLARLELIDVSPNEEAGQLEIIIRVVNMQYQQTEAIVGLR